MLPGQHAPVTHDPPQHFCPTPHWASPVQAWQAYWTHRSGCGQSALAQQSPRRHFPPQHLRPLPHAESELQASPGWPFPLEPPPLLPGQLPSTWQLPLQHTKRAGQSELAAQAPHWLPVQT